MKLGLGLSLPGVAAQQGKSLAYISLPGTSGTYAATPDAAALDITGDIDIRALVALDDWTPAVQATIASKDDSASRSWRFYVTTGGALGIIWYPTGLTASALSAPSTAAVSAANGQMVWVRVAFDVADSTNRKFEFYTSSEVTKRASDVTWAQLGATVTQAGNTTLANSVAQLELGGFANAGAQQLVGKVFALQLRDGINGTVVFDWDLTRDGRSGTTTTALTGQTVTYTGSVSFGSLRV